MAIIGRFGDLAQERRLSVRITDADLLLLDEEANAHDMVVGYYLDLIIAAEANRVRAIRGFPPQPTPYHDADDPWRKAR